MSDFTGQLQSIGRRLCECPAAVICKYAAMTCAIILYYLYHEMQECRLPSHVCSRLCQKK